MGFQDRDYQRESFRHDAIPTEHLVSKAFMAICGVMFFLELVSPDRGAMIDRLSLSTRALAEGRVWTLITHAFLHDPSTPMHIVFNLLAFWWFATDLEDRLGRLKFMLVLAVGILVPAIAYLATRGMRLLPEGAGVIGASGCVNAVLTLAILRAPFQQIMLFGVLPLQAWVFLAISLALDAINLRRPDSLVASDMHLAGAAAGAVMFLMPSASIPPLFRRGLPRQRKRRYPAPTLTVFRGEEDGASSRKEAATRPSTPPAGKLEPNIDALLEKISREGMASLTDVERQQLLQASEKLRGRKP
mgnify:FL=1